MKHLYIISISLPLHLLQVEAFIALPGGVGTMEELTEILTWSKLNLHAKPIALLNVEGYYDHFIQWVGEL